MPSLTSIAEEVLAKARDIDRYLDLNGLAARSYNNDILADLPGDLQNVRYSLANSSNELKKLAQGPETFKFRNKALNNYIFAKARLAQDFESNEVPQSLFILSAIPSRENLRRRSLRSNCRNIHHRNILRLQNQLTFILMVVILGLWQTPVLYLALYLLYTVFYRVVLSPVAKFPGRKLAALTFWYG